MKNKDQIKFVYRLNHESVYVRHTCEGDRYLHLDFPVLITFNPVCVERILKCDFVTDRYMGKAWIDKHDNVIVRCMCDNIKQTKIDF